MYPGLTKHTALAPLSQTEAEASMTSDPKKIPNVGRAARQLESKLR